MSHVTNAILHMDFDRHRLDEVNQFFNGRRGFVLIADDWPYGGSKVLECDLAIGAFNYFEIEPFMEHLRGIQWESPENIQLIVKEQDDERFRIMSLRALDSETQHP